MPCLITTRSVIKKSTRKKATKTKFHRENYLNLKAPSNNVKLQSDKIQLHKFIFLTTHQMGIMRLGNKSTKRRINEAKLKKQHFLNQINSKVLKN